MPPWGGGGPDRRSRAVQASQTRASTASVAASAAAQSLRVRRRSASRCPAYPANCRWAARLAQPHRSWEESGRGGSDHPLWLGTIPSVDPWWRLIRDFKKKPHEIMSEATQGRFPADRWGPLERWGRKHPRGGGCRITEYLQVFCETMRRGRDLGCCKNHLTFGTP